MTRSRDFISARCFLGGKMKIGIVLGGGMAKGAYQLGALKAINEIIDLSDIKIISASSIGVLNGYAFLCNKLDQIEEMWKNIEYEGNRTFINKILKSSYLQQSIQNLHSEDDIIPKSFYATLFDFTKNTISYTDLKNVSSKDIPLYLKASVAMPFYNKSVSIGNHSYFDGGFGDNIPVFPVVSHNLDYIICIYFDACCYIFENKEFDKKVLKLTFSNKDILRENIVLSKNSIERMIITGYDITKELLIRISDINDKDQLYKAIEYNNYCNKTGGIRITSDLIVTNINKITKKFSKRKIII